MMPEAAEPVSDLQPTVDVRATTLPPETAKPPKPLDPVARARRLKLGVWGRARFILVGSATHIVEFGGGLILLTWGLWLALPFHVFTADPILYRVMATLAPEWAWGGVGMAIGLGTIWVLLTDGRAGRARMAVLQFCMWLFVCLFIGQSSGFRATAVPIYGMLALGAGWVYVRLERDKRRPG